MKFFKPIVLMAMIALTACTEKSPNLGSLMTNSTPTISQHQAIPISEQKLLGVWRLENHALKGEDNQPLTLQFASLNNNNGEVLVLNGCNNLNADYQIHNGQLKVSSPISTRMMCEPNLMQIDNLATKLLAGKVGLEKFVDGLPEHSYLKITVDGKDYKFTRVE